MISIYRIFQWALVILVIGVIVGSISAFFLVGLKWVTNTRENNFLWVLLLPVGGAIIGYSYYYLEKGVEGGNNRLIKEMIVPRKKIHWKMTPLVLFGTLATHLFGGSAGREGTAVQMGGASADQFVKLFNWEPFNRKTILRAGVAAGFGGIFGTPIAAVLFAYELGRDKKFNPLSFLPIALAAYLADFICHAWQVEHAYYEIYEFPSLNINVLSWALIAGLIFGLAALSFNYCKIFFKLIFSKLKYAPIRPIIGGALIVLIVFLLDTTKYLGLGVPIIQNAFMETNTWEVFFIKLLLTAFTLGAGFKGGEATPLFFMGATLGSFIVLFVPLPLSLLAGMGFVAVFAGSTNTPIACTFMACELFGWDGFVYYAIACFAAYLISGNSSVYKSQQEYLHKLSFVDRFKKTK